LAGLAATYSSKPLGLVPLAQESLTAEFEMGSGSVSPQKPPGRPRTFLKQAASAASSTARGLNPRLCAQKCIGLSFQCAPYAFFRNAMGIGNESNQDNRAISTGKLNALPRLHTRPINVVVYHGSQGRTRFEVGFSLRCLQRLSRPHIATLHCRWRDNSSTRGASIPVLSY
jgi:hypothetical protein